MQAILGVLFHSLGGVAAGSFYMPYNKVKGWSWESNFVKYKYEFKKWDHHRKIDKIQLCLKSILLKRKSFYSKQLH